MCQPWHIENICILVWAFVLLVFYQFVKKNWPYKYSCVQTGLLDQERRPNGVIHSFGVPFQVPRFDLKLQLFFVRDLDGVLDSCEGNGVGCKCVVYNNLVVHLCSRVFRSMTFFWPMTPIYIWHRLWKFASATSELLKHYHYIKTLKENVPYFDP